MRLQIAGLISFFFTTTLSVQNLYQSERGFGPVHLEKHQFQINLLMPGLSYEIGIARNQTASAEIGLGLVTPKEGYSLSPAYNVKYRYYHNIRRRLDLDRKVSGNSANFVAASFSHYFTQYEILGNMDNSGQDLIFIGPVYGLQRTYANGLGFSVDAGLGYYFRNRISSGIGPSVHFKLSWNPFHK